MDGNPYVGPRAFNTAESDYFFGREEEIEILQGLVMSRRVVLLFAKSGVGKSSLVRAGLIPRLTAERTVGRGRRARRLPPKMKTLPIGTVGGGLPSQLNQPLDNVYSFIALYSMQSDDDVDPNTLAGQTLAEGLADLIGSDGNSPPDDLPVLLVLDQFEELFTRHLTRWEDREGFFRQISQALDNHPPLHVLFVMREDFIAELTPYTNLIPGRLESDYRLERLNKDAALKAVKQPAADAERPFAEGVAEELVDNLRRVQTGQRGSTGKMRSEEPASSDSEQATETTPIHPSSFILHPSSALGVYVEPVHLQIVCRQLWASLPLDCTTIEASHVQAFGDVDEALMNFYESTLQEMMQVDIIDVSERRLRNWFDNHLVTPARTKGLVYRGDDSSEGLLNAAVDILNEAYIIRANKRGSDTWYELAHDRLIEPILEANRRWQVDYHNPLAITTQAWLEAGRDVQKLIKSDQLAEAETYAQSHPQDVTEEEKGFLAESKRQETLEQEQTRQAARLRRNIIIGLAVGLVITLTSAIFAGYQWFQAKKELDAIRSREALVEQIAQSQPIPRTDGQAVRQAVRHLALTSDTVWGSLYNLETQQGLGLFGYNPEQSDHPFQTDVGQTDNNEIMAFFGSGDKIWLAIAEGVQQATGQPNELTFTEVLSVDDVRSLAQDDKGQLWVGTFTGLYQQSPTKWEFLNDIHSFCPDIDSSSFTVNRIVFDPKGNAMWLATDVGLIRWPLVGITTEIICYGGDDYLTALALDASGRPWVGTSEGTVKLLAEGVDTPTLADDQWQPYPLLSPDPIQDLLVLPAGSLLVGTLEDGLFMYHSKTDKWEDVPLSEGEIGSIYDLSLDSTGYLWLGTNHGLYRSNEPFKP